jgi:hypothetical protein
MDINSTLVFAVIFAFVIAFIFSMFGQGGGSVYSPLLITLGYPILLATSTSLVLNLITSVSAGYIFYRKKMIDYKTSLIFIPGISIGAFAGGALSKSFNTAFLLWLFVIFLLGVGTRMIYSYWDKEKPEGISPKAIPLLNICSLRFSGWVLVSSPVCWELAVGYLLCHSWSTS